MTKTKAEMPSNAQHNGIGTNSTNSGVAASATLTAGEAVRTTAAAGALGG